MSQNNELRVFISSTFRDLQEEREHLVKNIFPEIRALCRQRGITFTEVDLRWGLTDEDIALGRVISTCLEEVDRCQPYFIGITGDRYGFIPTHLDIYKDPALLQQYPWIEDAVVEQMSITEMEAQYGVLRRRTEEGSSATQALFYFRRHRESLNDADGPDEERSRLDAYQNRIRESGAAIEQFRDPISLGELIYDDVVKIIKRDFADVKPPTPLEEERSRHEAFSMSRRRAYIPNPVYIKRLNDFVEGLGARDDGLGKEQIPSLTPNPHSLTPPSNPALVVYAESGSGKSSLFAYWAEQYRRKHPDVHVIEHYVGIGATATAHYGIIRHICMEINERFGREEEIPSEPAKLELALGQWLGYADHELSKRGERMVVILDGLNQLQGDALKLRWIPDVILPSIRLILSSTVEGTLIELRKRGWSELGMQALTEAERETIVVRYLAEYHKSLNPEQIKRIAGDYKCGHPLFLKTVLEELRLVGRHEELDAKITSYLEATGTEDLFQRVLERLEEDYNMRAVRDVMSLLSASRSGLDERELSEISGIARLKIATMMAGLDYHLVRKEGRLTFFHDYLRRAVTKRYLVDEGKQRTTHLQIAEYFQNGITASIAAGGNAPLRMASELCYQLKSGGAIDRLQERLSSMPVFLALYDGKTLYEVLRYWSLMDEGTDIVGMYRRSLSEWSQEDAAERRRGKALVTDLFERLGYLSAVIDLARERLAEAIERGEKIDEAVSRLAIGSAMNLRGSHVEALAEFTQALDLFTELDNRRGIAEVIGNLGLTYFGRGEYDRAIECFEHQLSIAEELSDRRVISFAIGNMGMVYGVRGDSDRAIECCERALHIDEERGDRLHMSAMISNTGIAYGDRREYARALEYFERSLHISEELGDRVGISKVIGNMGSVYFSRGEYDRAIECHERQLRVSEELGNRIGISLAIGGLGLVYGNRGEFHRALECYERQARIAEESGDRLGFALAVGNIGFTYLSLGNHERALANLIRAAEEHRAIGYRYGLTYWIMDIAWVLIELAEAGGAMPEYLPKYVPDVTVGTPVQSLHEAAGGEWLATSLRYARACAEESIAISEEISKPDTQFGGRVMLARIEAAEGRRDLASQRLMSMLEAAADDEQRAELHYLLWKIGEAGHVAQSLALYEALYAASPQHVYHKYIEEMKAGGES